MQTLAQLADQLVARGVVSSRSRGMAVLQTLLELGCCNELLDSSQVSAADNREYLAVLENIRQAENWSLKELRRFFKQRNTWLWQHYPRLYLETGRAVLQQSEPLLAYDIFKTGMKTLGSETVQLDQLDPEQAETAVQLIRSLAVSLVQGGAPSSAEHLLKRLVEQGITDSETMGLLGRVYKDIAVSKPDKAEYYFRQAFIIYFRAYGRAMRSQDYDGAYYNGINAATLAFLSGDRGQAGKLAREVEQLCLSLQEKTGKSGSSFWLEATLGEAALLQGDLDRAGDYYELACQGAAGDVLAMASIARQARLIIRHSGIRSNVKRAPSCRLPTVMVFSGHMIDSTSRKEARFPMARQAEIKEKISLEIKRLRGGIGYSAAAAGSDILFLEAMLDCGGKIHVVLPVDVDNFKEQSVAPAGHDWEERFDHLINNAETLTVLDTFNPGNFENSLEFTNMYLFGIARIRAEQMGTLLRPLAVLRANDVGGRGGTASMVRLWQGQQVEYSLISLPGSASLDLFEQDAGLQPLAPSCSCEAKAQHHTSLPMLFADVKGYSQLSEDEAVCFSNSFLRRVADILNRYDQAILSKRTAGDGLFLVFHDLKAAIRVARALQEMIHSHNWQLDSLPANLQMRISLDAGPCYSYIDPVMDKLEFCGNYVVRAARLEPITPPGHIYASDTFVALCRAAGQEAGAFSYAGQVILPKNYGTLAVFHVTP